VFQHAVSMNQESHIPIKPLSPDLLTTLPQEVQLYIQFLEKQIALLSTQAQGFALKIKELEDRLAKDSSNSSKPPSSDGLGKKPKTTSLREKSGRKPGGQPGHIGRTREQISYPNHIEVHTPGFCEHCFSSLTGVSSSAIEKRQVFDLPEVVIEVTEHQAEIKICPCCGLKTKGKFPDNIRGPVQYGERAHALASYLQYHHFIPFDRITQIFEDIYNISLSAGTCSKMGKRLFNNLEVFEASLKAHLLSCKVLHFDETGVRCEKKLNWIHVTSSASATFYGIHRKRGREAIDAFNILPRFTGTAVHDHWSPYFIYKQVKHGLCNVHHLRELKFVHEQEKEEWAQKVSTLLLRAKKITDQARDQGKCEIASEEIKIIECDYSNLLLETGKNYLGLSASIDQEAQTTGKTGLNLFKRLLRKMDSVLAFVYDLEVPFSNNLSEQDLRMEKVKQKISGCFRTFEGGVISCRVRSYISTARKQGWNILNALTNAVKGLPRLLPIPVS
jgi:transposase